MTIPVTGQTPIYQIEYLVDGEPMFHTRAKLQRNSEKLESLLQARAIAPPAAADLATVSGRVSTLEQHPADDLTLGAGRLPTQPSSAFVLAGDPAWTDLVTVTASTLTGETVDCAWDAVSFNAGSGADRTMSYRTVCITSGATVVLSSLTAVPIPLASSPRVARFGLDTHAPAAGSHTWKLQANASIGNAVMTEFARFTVRARGHR